MNGRGMKKYLTLNSLERTKKVRIERMKRRTRGKSSKGKIPFFLPSVSQFLFCVILPYEVARRSHIFAVICISSALIPGPSPNQTFSLAQRIKFYTPLNCCRLCVLEKPKRKMVSEMNLVCIINLADGDFFFSGTEPDPLPLPSFL